MQLKIYESLFVCAAKVLLWKFVVAMSYVLGVIYTYALTVQSNPSSSKCDYSNEMSWSIHYCECESREGGR